MLPMPLECRDLSSFLPAYVDGEVEGVETAEIEHHLTTAFQQLEERDRQLVETLERHVDEQRTRVVVEIGRAAVEAMAELGIDMSAEIPKVLTTEAVKESDVVITMGCGDECPYFPGKRYEDWVLEDPAGKGVDSVRPIRDEIKTRVEALIASLIPAQI